MQIQDSVAGILAVPSASKQQAITTWEGDKKSVSRSEKTGRRGRGQVSEKTGRRGGGFPPFLTLTSSLPLHLVLLSLSVLLEVKLSSLLGKCDPGLCTFSILCLFVCCIQVRRDLGAAGQWSEGPAQRVEV